MNSNSATVTSSLLGVRIEFNSIYCGKPLSKIQLPEKCALLGSLRNGAILPISANPTLETGDYVLAIALHPMMIPELEFVLKQGCPVYYSLIVQPIL